MIIIKKLLLTTIIILLTLLTSCTAEEEEICEVPPCPYRSISLYFNFEAYPDSSLNQIEIVRIYKKNKSYNDTILIVDRFTEVYNKTFDIGTYIHDDPEGYDLSILLNEKVEHSITNIISNSNENSANDCPGCPYKYISSLVLNDSLISNDEDKLYMVQLAPPN